ncbi:hypothetical protein FPV67DRAFT_537853 [Lyophyllum atratum]|nr:hypothetical protein FPV67DRAFT_537853 [Lyophyllum atratum]
MILTVGISRRSSASVMCQLRAKHNLPTSQRRYVKPTTCPSCFPSPFRRAHEGCIALLYYDYALTFGMEIKYIWNEKFRISTFLYFCCRYSLVANIIYLLTISNKLPGKLSRRLRCQQCP